MKKSRFALPKVENKISEENAMEQVMLLLVRYNIDVEDMDNDVRKATEQTITRFLGCVMRGTMEVFKTEGQVKVKQIIQHRSEGSTVSEIIYGSLRGKDHQAMGEGDDVNNYVRMHDLLGSICEAQNGPEVIKMLSTSDLKDAEALALLFL